ncbi:MAG: tetratricopeptide repeat protein, partial [Candidatus Heimdallarchaeota archaeon]|nr:tetratricopeptide repeat protein [Candidatus Heimdallarchaeota archaeon]
LVPDQPNYQILLAQSYLLTGKLDKGLKVLEKLLSTNPDNVGALLRMGQLYLHKNDLEAAEQVFKKAILFQPEDEKYWSKILDHIVYARNNPVGIDFLVPFTGNYTLERGRMTIPHFIHNDHLMNKAKNQYPFHMYPVSDSQFVSYNGFIYKYIFK